MILGMSQSTFVLLHVVISLIGIVAGLIVMFGMLGSKRQPGLTAVFLLTTILTSATGFLIPPLLFDKTLPSHIVGALTLVLVAIASLALYRYDLVRSWRWIFVVSAVAALYLNVFVAVFQAFLKIPVLHALAPTQSEPPFAIAQLCTLVLFAGAGIVALRLLHVRVESGVIRPAVL